jgi:putative endonuclease
MGARHTLGARGEQLVAERLQGQGFELLARNVRSGRLELDIVATRGDLVVFCEVRTLTSNALYEPAESVGPAKIARVRRAAAQWLAGQQRQFREIRFDVASVVISGPEPLITYYEDAF